MAEFQKADGARYAPRSKAVQVCKPGEFRFAAVGLNHGHIYGMCNGLIEAGGELVTVFDPDPKLLADFRAAYPGVPVAAAEDAILQDPTITLVASAAIPARRAALGLRVLDHGKDYFSDKPILTTLEQLEAARQKTAATGRKYAGYYSERLHVEAAVYAGELVQEGAIGRVLQVIGLGPHRESAPTRPPWFYDRAQFGGILCDLASHQVEQFLFYTGAHDAQVLHSKVANYAHPQYPEFEDFGDATLLGDNGATQYLRVDWFTPAGLGSWGDGRTFLLGTKGYIELRKYLDVGREPEADHVYIVDGKGERHIPVHGKIGYPFFGQLILDCLNRTEKAQTQAHVFKTAELAVRAQMVAVRIEAGILPEGHLLGSLRSE